VQCSWEMTTSEYMEEKAKSKEEKKKGLLAVPDGKKLPDYDNAAKETNRSEEDKYSS